MKIMSLNVNNFGGLLFKKPIWSDNRSKQEYNEEMRLFQNDPLRVNAAEAVISTIREVETPDVVVFQEFDVNAPAGRRTFELLVECGYRPIYPDEEKEISGNYSITMIFAKKQLKVIPYASPKIMIGGKTKWEWRWCVANIDGLMMFGVHAPTRGRDDNIQKFFDKLQECSKKNRTEKAILLGDMNVHSKKPCSFFTTFDAIRKNSEGGLGYSDEIKDGQITYFPAGTTIDHVLVSPALKDNVTAVKVFEQKELELSDHAVIVVDVDL